MHEAEQASPGTELQEAPKMSLPSRLFDFFLGSPTKAAQSLRQHAGWTDWVVPILITFVVTAVVGRMTQDITINEIRQKVSTNTRMTQEQIDMALNRMDQQQQKWKSPGYQVVAHAISLVVVAILTAIVGGIILFIVNVLLGGEARFIHALTLASWGGWLVHMRVVTGGFIIGLFPAIVKTPMILAKQSTDVTTSLAILLPDSMKGQFLYQLVSKLDIFNIWLLVIMSIGIGVLARASTKKASAWVVGIWLIVAIVGSLLSSFLLRAQGFA